MWTAGRETRPWSTAVRIRGLNVDSAALGDYAVSAVSTVSTYVDDTPIFANFLLKDIQRVEVLRGPQGTLYGSGALGGTVRYVMNPPELGEFEGERRRFAVSSVEGSDGIGAAGDITLNLPLGDTMAVRVNVTYADYPGITDYVNLYVLDDKGIPVARTAFWIRLRSMSPRRTQTPSNRCMGALRHAGNRRRASTRRCRSSASRMTSAAAGSRRRVRMVSASPMANTRTARSSSSPQRATRSSARSR